MTDAVAIAIVGAVATVPATIGGVLSAWFSYKASAHASEAAEIAKTVKNNTDGMKTELVSLTARSSRAIGNLEGRAEAAEELAHVEPAASGSAPKSE